MRDRQNVYLRRPATMILDNSSPSGRGNRPVFRPIFELLIEPLLEEENDSFMLDEVRLTISVSATMIEAHQRSGFGSSKFEPDAANHVSNLSHKTTSRPGNAHTACVVPVAVALPTHYEGDAGRRGDCRTLLDSRSEATNVPAWIAVAETDGTQGFPPFGCP